MILTFDSLALQYKDYTDVKGKIRREVQSGRLTQITRLDYTKPTRARTANILRAQFTARPIFLSIMYCRCVR